jgi:hypothetical protein
MIDKISYDDILQIKAGQRKRFVFKTGAARHTAKSIAYQLPTLKPVEGIKRYMCMEEKSDGKGFPLIIKAVKG